MKKPFLFLAWAWMIIVGGYLLITPGGVFCIACGSFLNNLIAVISLVFGIAGLATGTRATQER